MSVDAVPAWSPVGRPADRYRSDRSGDEEDSDGPLVETLAHHRDRWHHVADHAAFVDLLHFSDFDPDEWTGLARDTGAGSIVVTAIDRYGLRWFDTCGETTDVTTIGPRRDVLGAIAAACERDDLVLGTMSCATGSDVHGHSYEELVRRYGVRRLAGSRTGLSSGTPPAGAVDAARLVDPTLVVDDLVLSDRSAVRTFAHRPPSERLGAEWELRRSIGAGAAFNRAERDEHLASPSHLVADLTEAIAKGGHLLLGVGVDAHGRIPAVHAERCRAVGGWVRRHRDLVDRGEPWQRWGDDECRFVTIDGVVHVVDVSGRGRFAPLTPDLGRVERIESLDGSAVAFEQARSGVSLDRRARRQHRLPQVYRLTVGPRPEPPVRLFEATEPTPPSLAALLDTAARGTVVQLGDGDHRGSAVIPSGITVRGLGPDRTRLVLGVDETVELLARSRLEHCSVVHVPDTRSGRSLRGRSLLGRSLRATGDAAVVVDCAVAGSIEVTASHVRLVSVVAPAIVGLDVDHLVVVRSTVPEPEDPGVFRSGIVLTSGSGHLVDSCRFGAGEVGVLLERTVGAVVRGNRFRSCRTGVRGVDAEDSAILANSFDRVSRAVDIAGGSGSEVSGNLASGGDSGAVVRSGATDIVVAGNRWERTRIGLLVWDAGLVRHHDNTCIDLGDEDGALVTGP